MYAYFEINIGEGDLAYLRVSFATKIINYGWKWTGQFTIVIDSNGGDV